jgi:hypothetical protein
MLMVVPWLLYDRCCVWCADGKVRAWEAPPGALRTLLVFAGSGHPELAKEVCEYLNIPLGKSHSQRQVRGGSGPHWVVAGG